MKATATQNSDGTWEIEVDGVVIRKKSKKLFASVFTFHCTDRFGAEYKNHHLSNDSQLRRIYGDPTVTEITTNTKD